MKLDKKIVALNDTIIAVNPLVKDVVLLISKISEQMVIISCDFKKNLAINLENYLLKTFRLMLINTMKKVLKWLQC